MAGRGKKRSRANREALAVASSRDYELRELVEETERTESLWEAENQAFVMDWKLRKEALGSWL